jgi:hypothetical protein
MESQGKGGAMKGRNINAWKSEMLGKTLLNDNNKQKGAGKIRVDSLCLSDELYG